MEDIDMKEDSTIGNREVNQSVGNISNSSVSALNIYGNQLYIAKDNMQSLMQIVEGYQKLIAGFQRQTDRLISIIEKDRQIKYCDDLSETHRGKDLY